MRSAALCGLPLKFKGPASEMTYSDRFNQVCIGIYSNHQNFGTKRFSQEERLSATNLEPELPTIQKKDSGEDTPF